MTGSKIRQKQSFVVLVLTSTSGQLLEIQELRVGEAKH